VKTSLYDRDFYAWANEQAALLRAGRLTEADIENIAEEIESMGRREKRELVSRLTVLLLHTPIRDHAWSITDASAHHIALWSDLTRRARPDLVPAPACLLAFAAWRAGEGTLATLALNRALAADPGYRMAQLLYQMVQAGLPPSALDGWSA